MRWFDKDISVPFWGCVDRGTQGMDRSFDRNKGLRLVHCWSCNDEATSIGK